LFVISSGSSRAQSPSRRTPDVSNKALITKSTPAINPETFKNQNVNAAVAAERRAIKKSARRHLKQQLLSELEEGD